MIPDTIICYGELVSFVLNGRGRGILLKRQMVDRARDCSYDEGELIEEVEKYMYYDIPEGSNKRGKEYHG